MTEWQFFWERIVDTLLKKHLLIEYNSLIKIC